MKLVNLVKAGNTTGETVVYISAGDGYFPRFGSYPLPTNGDVYKFADSDKLYVWDGSLLRPSEPEEGDTAYGQDGKYAGKFNHGLWWLTRLGLPLTEELLDEADEEVYQLRIGNVSFDIDPIQFVEDNRELIDAIMAEYLCSKQETTLKINTPIPIFLRDSNGTVPLNFNSPITGFQIS